MRPYLLIAAAYGTLAYVCHTSGLYCCSPVLLMTALLCMTLVRWAPMPRSEDEEL